MKAPPPVAWQTLSEAEKLVWAASFAGSRSPDPEESGREADAVVYRFRSLPDREYLPMRNPEWEAAYANLAIERSDFDVWYRIQMQIRFGNRPEFRVPSSEECAKAFSRYQRGLDGYY